MIYAIVDTGDQFYWYWTALFTGLVMLFTPIMEVTYPISF